VIKKLPWESFYYQFLNYSPVSGRVPTTRSKNSEHHFLHFSTRIIVPIGAERVKNQILFMTNQFLQYALPCLILSKFLNPSCRCFQAVGSIFIFWHYLKPHAEYRYQGTLGDSSGWPRTHFQHVALPLNYLDVNAVSQVITILTLEPMIWYGKQGFLPTVHGHENSNLRGTIGVSVLSTASASSNQSHATVQLRLFLLVLAQAWLYLFLAFSDGVWATVTGSDF